MVEDRSVLSRTARLPDDVWHYGADPDQVADIYRPAPGVPERRPVLLVHGGFWRPAYDRTHCRPMAQALADRGHLVALLEYRRRPGDPDAMVDDVLTAVASAHEVVGVEQPVIVGHSAGGHLALLATQAPGTALSGCLALAPVADLVMADDLALEVDAVHAFLGGPAASRPDLDPARLEPTVPVTVVHGERDEIVPASIPVSYCERSGARLALLPEVAHFAVIDPESPAWAEVLAELDALAFVAGGE